MLENINYALFYIKAFAVLLAFIAPTIFQATGNVLQYFFKVCSMLSSTAVARKQLCGCVSKASVTPVCCW